MRFPLSLRRLANTCYTCHGHPEERDAMLAALSTIVLALPWKGHEAPLPYLGAMTEDGLPGLTRGQLVDLLHALPEPDRGQSHFRP